MRKHFSADPKASNAGLTVSSRVTRSKSTTRSKLAQIKHSVPLEIKTNSEPEDSFSPDRLTLLVNPRCISGDIVPWMSVSHAFPLAQR